jgi:hypothetical protein
MISSRGMNQRLAFLFGVGAIFALTLATGGFLEAQVQPKKDAKPAASAKDDAKDAAKDTKDAKDAPKGEEGDAKESSSKDSKKEAVKKEVKFIPNFPIVKDKMASAQGQAQISKINELIKEKWLANHINPSPRCTDYEFIRRASLDIVGRIATETEIKAYMNQSPETRRSWLVEKLLASPEFGENFANIWTVMMLTRSGSIKDYQEMMRDWLTERFNSDLEGDKKMADWSSIVFDILTATGKDNSNAAVNYIAHHPGEEIKNDESKKGRASEMELQQNGRWDMIPVTSRTTRLFLGLRTQCVQCHDHPFNADWQQSHFWGINAFFRQTDISQRPTMMMAQKKKKGVEPRAVHVEVHDNPTWNEKGVVSYERRSGVLLYTGMQFLDGTRVKEVPTGSTRRQELAKLVTKSPYFAKVFVNRTWAHFLGKSFTRDASDDFGEHNPVTNPELLDYLSDEFAKNYGHSPKDLVRWICNSQAYGLSSRTNLSNDGVAREGDDRSGTDLFFARVISKTMSPEQLFDSLMTATAGRVMSQQHTIKVAKEAKTAKETKNGKDAKSTEAKTMEGKTGVEAKEEYRQLRNEWLKSLVLNFGNDEGDEATFSGTVVQALMLINGKDINDAINNTEVGTVASVNREKGLAITKGAVDTLYLAALNRPCTAEELQRISSPATYGYHIPASLKTAARPGTPQFNAAYYQDIFWALLNSSEFILNH